MLKWDSDDGRGHGGHIQGGDVLRKYEVNGGGSQPHNARAHAVRNIIPVNSYGNMLRACESEGIKYRRRGERGGAGKQ
jgi:hypothetical protein